MLIQQYEPTQGWPLDIGAIATMAPTINRHQVHDLGGGHFADLADH